MCVVRRLSSTMMHTWKLGTLNMWLGQLIQLCCCVWESSDPNAPPQQDAALWPLMPCDLLCREMHPTLVSSKTWPVIKRSRYPPYDMLWHHGSLWRYSTSLRAVCEDNWTPEIGTTLSTPWCQNYSHYYVHVQFTIISEQTESRLRSCFRRSNKE